MPRRVFLQKTGIRLTPQAQQRGGRLRDVHVHRVKLLYRGQRRGLIGSDQRTFGDQGAPDTAGDRRQHARIDQVDPRRLHRRLRLQRRGNGIVVVLFADRIGFGQGLVALRERPSRSFGRHGAVVSGFVGRRIDLIQLLARLDLAALNEQPLQDDAVHLRSHVGRAQGVCSSGQLSRDWHRLGLHGDDGDFRRWRGGRRPMTATAGQEHRDPSE